MTKREKMPEYLPQEMEEKMKDLLHLRYALSREDLEYLVEKTEKMKDKRLKACIATLIGWGDDERAEVETFIAVMLEILKRTNPSKVREAARIVNIRYLIKEGEKNAD